MFSRLIRDYKILVNHKKRVNSVVIRPNEDVIRIMDLVRNQYLEAERKEDKEKTLKYKSMLDVFEWLTNDTKRTP